MHVNFDEYLDMAPYCTAPSTNTLSTRSKQYETSKNECMYRLRGVIVHYGKSINTGHFVAFVYNDALGKRLARCEEGERERPWRCVGEWLRCDDHIIEQTTFDAVKTSDAYILVYSRCAANATAASDLSNPAGLH